MMKQRKLVLYTVFLLAIFYSFTLGETSAKTVVIDEADIIEDVTVIYNPGLGTYIKDSAAVTLEMGNTTTLLRRSYIVWNISSIPNGATITNVTFNYRTNKRGNVTITNPTQDLSLLSTQLAFDAINSGTILVPGGFNFLEASGDNLLVFGANASTAFQSAITSGKFVLGFRAKNESFTFAAPAYSIFSTRLAAETMNLTITYTPPSQHTFFGLFYENGTISGVPANVTLFFSNDTNKLISFTGSQIIQADNNITLFTWDLIGGGIRIIYPTALVQNFTLFTPEVAFSEYLFNVIDYTGEITRQNIYLESTRIINNTRRIIERRLIRDSLNDVPLIMANNKLYQLRIRFEDDTLSEQGFFDPGIDPNPTVIIKDIAFSRQAQFASSYIFIEATRPAPATSIIVDYNDTLTATTLVVANLRYRNQTLVASQNSTGQIVQFVFGGLTNTTDYVVEVLVTTSNFFSQSLYRRTLGGTVNFQAFPSLTALGNIAGSSGGINMDYVLPLLLLMVIAGAFSVKTLASGSVVIGLFLAAFVFMGALAINSNVVVLLVGGGLILGFALSRRK